MNDVIASKVVARFLSAAMPSQIKRLVSDVRKEQVEEKSGKVLVHFKTEAQANKFEDKAKAALHLEDPEEAEDSNYEVYGGQDPKTGEYTITITY